METGEQFMKKAGKQTWKKKRSTPTSVSDIS
jgi:hypothetical protein